MLPLDKIRNLNTIICDPQATVSGMCGTGIIIQGRIVHGSIFRKKALSGTEMIPKQYNTPLRHRKLVGLHMENRPLLGIYLTSGTIINPDLPSGNNRILILSVLKFLISGHFSILEETLSLLENVKISSQLYFMIRPFKHCKLKIPVYGI